MDEAGITRYIASTFSGVDVVVASKENGAPEIARADSFFIYDPDRNLDDARRFPFATIVTKDYADFDNASKLDRLIPHPVYGRNHWVSVLNPSDSTFESIKPLLQEAGTPPVARPRTSRAYYDPSSSPVAAPSGMKFPKPSEEAKAAFTKMVPDEPAVALKPMFGQLSAFVNGNMFCFLWGDDLLVRLPDPDVAALKTQGGRDFSPMPGRTGMAGYVTVPGGWRAKPATALIKKALAHTRQMPAKAPKKKAAAASKRKP